MPVNVTRAMEAINARSDNPIATAMIQGLHNGGNNAFKDLPKETRDKALGYYLDNGITIEASNLLPEESLGHHDHVMWILENNNEKKKAKEDDKDKIEDNDEDKGNDKDETKKRKVDN